MPFVLKLYVCSQSLLIVPFVIFTEMAIKSNSLRYVSLLHLHAASLACMRIFNNLACQREFSIEYKSAQHTVPVQICKKSTVKPHLAATS